MTDIPPRLVFLLGVRARSGTNYVADLLCAHPDCSPARGIGEDRILQNIHVLDEFVEAPNWRAKQRAPLTASLRARFGESIVAELAATRPDSPSVMIKSPSIQGIERLRDYFPDAPLLLVVRDGGAVAESARRTFGPGATLEYEARQWASGARRILDFVERDPGPHALVRYEDLVIDPEPELRRVFGIFGLDPDRYDYAKARDTPVRGSSTYRDTASGPHWKPLPKTSTFQPLARAAEWPAGHRRRFDAIAGVELARLGYERDAMPGGALTGVADASATMIDRTRRWTRALGYRWRRVRAMARSG